MKTCGFRAGALAFGLALAMAVPVVADERAADKAGAKMSRATAITGLTVRNKTGEDIGKIRDLAVHPRQGHVAYLVMGYGGALGIGEKYFAIPLAACEMASASGNPADRVLTVDVAKAELDSAAGFKANAYPDEIPPPFNKVKGDINRPGGEKEPVRKASDLYQAVKNNNGDHLGKIVDFVFDPKTGNIRYFALGHGGVVASEKLFAVPSKALTMKALDKDPQNVHWVLNVDKATLENSPGFDKNAWPNEANTTLFKEAARDAAREPQKQ
jgi:sporulation protein YlmC with PRC-barrel domain